MGMLRAAAAALFLSAAATTASAQVIHGRLIDDVTGDPIAGGQITLMQDSRPVLRAVVTDNAGRFRLQLRSPGAYQLRGENIGYRTGLSSPVHLMPTDTIAVELRLGVDAVVLAPLTVTAATRMPLAQQRLAEFHARARRGFGQYLGPDEISRMIPFYATDLLRDMNGVTVRPAMGGNVVTMRGVFSARLDGSSRGQSCSPTFYVDGNMLRGISLDEAVSGSAIRAVEVYRRASQVPPVFSSPKTFDCGAIAVWTTFTMPDRR